MLMVDLYSAEAVVEEPARRPGDWRRSSWRGAAAAVGAAVLLLCGLARAEGTCPRPESPARARQLAAEAFQQAERLYSARDCAAIERFQCSFELFPHPATLFNVGRTAEDCGQLDVAATAYRTYVEAYPDESDRADVDSRLRAVEGRLAEAAAAPPPPPPPAPTGEEATGGGVAGDDDPPPPPPAPRPTDPMYLGGWITAGLGAALVITGGALFGVAGARHAEFLQADEDGADAVELERLRTEGQGFETGGGVTIGIGAAAIAASVVLLWLSWPHPADTRASGGSTLVAPILGRQLAGLSLSGRF